MVLSFVQVTCDLVIYTRENQATSSQKCLAFTVHITALRVESSTKFFIFNMLSLFRLAHHGVSPLKAMQ